MQKTLLLSSTFFVSALGLITYPFLSRIYSSEEFAAISILIYLSAFFGTFDLLRPSITRLINTQKTNGQSATFNPLISIKSAIKIYILSLPLLIILSITVLSRNFNYIEQLFIAASFFIFLIYSIFWGVLDGCHKVGTAMLARTICLSFFYFILLLAKSSNASFTFLVTQALTLLLLFILSYKNLNFTSHTRTKIPKLEIKSTGKQNIAKLCIDFSDRIMISSIFTPTLVSAYNSLYDISSKTNIISQTINSYCYPKLCQQKINSFYFLEIGLFISSALCLLSLASNFYAESLVSYYLSKEYAQYYFFLPVFLLSSSLYSIAFFQQSIYRAKGKFKELSTIFSISASLGIISLPISYYLFSVRGILLSLCILKSPGLIALLFDWHKGHFPTKTKVVAATYFLLTLISVYIIIN